MFSYISSWAVSKITKIQHYCLYWKNKLFIYIIKYKPWKSIVRLELLKEDMMMVVVQTRNFGSFEFFVTSKHDIQTTLTSDCSLQILFDVIKNQHLQDYCCAWCGSTPTWNKDVLNNTYAPVHLQTVNCTSRCDCGACYSHVAVHVWRTGGWWRRVKNTVCVCFIRHCCLATVSLGFVVKACVS